MSNVRRNLLAQFDSAYDYEFMHSFEVYFDDYVDDVDNVDERRQLERRQLERRQLERRQLFDIATFCLPVPDIEDKECPICLENTPRAEMVMTNCHHHVCFECMQQHLKALHESGHLPCCSLCRAEYEFIELPDENKCVLLERILRPKR